MTPFREDKKAENFAARLKKCADRQDAVMKMDGTLMSVCADCSAQFWMHPVFGRSTRCCGCRVAHYQKMQAKLTDSYTPKAGFPKTQQFQDEPELAEYLSNHKLTCLECGHEFRGLQQHINHRHLMSADEYKVKFGIPLGYGLVGSETKELLKVYQTAANAALTKEELTVRVERMHAAHPRTGGIVSTQPIIKKKRAAVIKKMIASDRHISKTVTGTTFAPCSQCGDVYEAATWSVVTNPCGVKCTKCSTANERLSQARWAKRNPDRVKEYQKNYRERLRAAGVLYEREKRKREAKKQKITCQHNEKKELT